MKHSLVTLMQLTQPKNVVKVFLQCICVSGGYCFILSPNVELAAVCIPYITWTIWQHIIKAFVNLSNDKQLHCISRFIPMYLFCFHNHGAESPYICMYA